jgi:hypothetical protein
MAHVTWSNQGSSAGKPLHCDDVSGIRKKPIGGERNRYLKVSEVRPTNQYLHLVCIIQFGVPDLRRSRGENQVERDDTRSERHMQNQALPSTKPLQAEDVLGIENHPFIPSAPGLAVN